MDQHSTLADRVLVKLTRDDRLTADDKAILRRALDAVRRLRKGDDLRSAGAQDGRVSFLLDGFACRYRTMPNGEQQILALYVPGDVIDLDGLLLRSALHQTRALSAAVVAHLSFDRIGRLMEEFPNIRHALWRDMAAEGAVAQEWLACLGRRSASGRLAHIICELLVRLNRVGMALEQPYHFPLTQHDLADALGLSIVHINRVVQQLRRERLITLHDSTLIVDDWTGLVAAAGFDSAYLFL